MVLASAISAVFKVVSRHPDGENTSIVLTMFNVILAILSVCELSFCSIVRLKPEFGVCVANVGEMPAKKFNIGLPAVKPLANDLVNVLPGTSTSIEFPLSRVVLVCADQDIGIEFTRLISALVAPTMVKGRDPVPNAAEVTVNGSGYASVEAAS